jgi:hypothetical protein
LLIYVYFHLTIVFCEHTSGNILDKRAKKPYGRVKVYKVVFLYLIVFEHIRKDMLSH